MRCNIAFIVKIILFSLLLLLLTGAKNRPSPIFSSRLTQGKEIKFLELKRKKELSDKKLSPLKKYTLAILAAREFKDLHLPETSLYFYDQAKNIKVDINKTELLNALSKKPITDIPLFFYEIKLTDLIKNKSYEKAILSFNPDQLEEPLNSHYKIIYDLLNVKIKRMSVKKLYCFDDYQKNPEDYRYSNLLCDLLIDYLRDGKLRNSHIKEVEDYFLKHDLKEIYLIQIAKDLKSPQ